MACALGHHGDCTLSIALYLLQPERARMGYAVPADCLLSCLHTVLRKRIGKGAPHEPQPRQQHHAETTFHFRL